MLSSARARRFTGYERLLTGGKLVPGTHPARVTAVIPTYNHERFIGDAIASVLEQTHSAVECVVVDDGSTDGTRDVVAAFGDRVRYIHKENEGVASARNVGIKAAAGQYVAFLDSDDLWLPRKIELQLRCFAANPSLGLCYTGLHAIDEASNFVGRLDPPAPAVALRNTLLIERPIISLAQTGVAPIEVLLKLGGFDESLSMSADSEFACRIAARYRIAAVRRPLTLYRQLGTSMSVDPTLVELDGEAMIERLFQPTVVGPSLARLRRRARANLYVMLAGGFLREGQFSTFARYAVRALFQRPDRLLAAGWRLIRPGGLRGRWGI